MKDSWLPWLNLNDSILFQIGGKEMLVGLRTPNWREQIEMEMSLVRSNTGMLFNTFSNSLLGEDFSIPTMSFDGKLCPRARYQ